MLQNKRHKFPSKSLIFLFTFILLIFGTVSSSAESWVRSNLERRQIGVGTQQCNCAKARKDALICGTNGITYTSTCSFECGKQKYPDLQKFKNGICGRVPTLKNGKLSYPGQ